MTNTEILNHDESFRYMLLDRLRLDCKYFISSGKRTPERILWSGSIDKHIDTMKTIYNSFTDDKKPEWLTMEQINEFETEMKKGA